MIALVTGSNGFIGRNLCARLVAEGWQVVGLDDLSGGLASYDLAEADYVRGSVVDRDLVGKLVRELEPDLIFHLAAKPRVSHSVEQPYLTAQTNVMGTLGLLEAIVHAGLAATTRFIFSGSSSVYGGTEIRPTPESSPVEPKSPYALQKYQAEQWCQHFSKLYKVDTVILRYFNVFGPHSLVKSAYSAVLSAWIYHLVVDPETEAFLEGDGSQSRDFTYIDNVVQANFLAATSSRTFTGEVFNIAQGRTHTLLECKLMLEELTGKTLNLEKRPTRIGDIKHSEADISKAKRELGYNPVDDFPKQLELMIDWYRDHYPRDQNPNDRFEVSE